ncbi:hypothetical protein Ancab_001759 [Ancistrocladus abbreviatus]
MEQRLAEMEVRDAEEFEQEKTQRHVECEEEEVELKYFVLPLVAAFAVGSPGVAVAGSVLVLAPVPLCSWLFVDRATCGFVGFLQLSRTPLLVIVGAAFVLCGVLI